MTTVEIVSPKGSAWLHIPSGWDAFIFQGYLYVLNGTKWICVEELPK